MPAMKKSTVNKAVRAAKKAVQRAKHAVATAHKKKAAYKKSHH